MSDERIRILEEKVAKMEALLFPVIPEVRLGDGWYHKGIMQNHGSIHLGCVDYFFEIIGNEVVTLCIVGNGSNDYHLWSRYNVPILPHLVEEYKRDFVKYDHNFRHLAYKQIPEYVKVTIRNCLSGDLFVDQNRRKEYLRPELLSI